MLYDNCLWLPINAFFSFDLGTGSIGECVRQGREIKHIDSLILPSDFASTSDQAKRRRQIRTRKAHKAREKWWRKCAADAGIEVLETRQPTHDKPHIKPDERMLREFPENNDNTIYTSCLLRIALLQGRQLEGWQIFKAIWSAMQHRGYDATIPWKSRIKNKHDVDNVAVSAGFDKNSEDEKENKEAVGEYDKRLNEYFGNDDKFKYPCYYEAYRLGIWEKNEPENLTGCLWRTKEPLAARNREGADKPATPSRQLIIKELRALLLNAGKQYQYLKENVDLILFGEGKTPYASYNDPEYKKFRGKDWDWQGILSQKIPRFDNRVINKCCLMPRFNVCKAKDLLNNEVSFLLSLKNMRYRLGHEEKMLTAPQINACFEKFKEKLDQEKLPKNIVGTRDWKLWLKEAVDKDAEPFISQKKIAAPKLGGRSRFCRPVLSLLKKVLLSGMSPHEKYDELKKTTINTNLNKGCVVSDYSFLMAMPKEWAQFYIPDARIEEAELATETARLARINKIINEVNNPVVRHRLNLFLKRLRNLSSQFGTPDQLILEFVRDGDNGWGGERKKKIEKAQKENRKKKEDAIKDLEASGGATIRGQRLVTKMILFKEQGGIDFYGLKPLDRDQLDSYEIDHIVPREAGGPDSMLNKILTTHDNNAAKGKHTPYEWLSSTDRWDAYVNKVQGCTDKKLSKKMALLTAANAHELVEKYTNLAETAYISKLAQRVAALYFNWPQQVIGSDRRIYVANGAYTANMRRRYGLDRLLHTDKTDEEFVQLVRDKKIDEKNRANLRHHALDALVISFWKERSLDPDSKKDKLPDYFNRDFCAEILKQVIPKPLALKKPVLAENFYGLRPVVRKQDAPAAYCFIIKFGTGTAMKDFFKIEDARKYTSGIFDRNIRETFTARLNTTPPPTQEEWAQFLKGYHINKTKPRKIAQIASGVVEDNKYGEYTNLNKSSHMPLNKRFGKDKKEHKGQLVSQDKKGNWRVDPVYVFESEWQKRRLLKEHAQGEVFFFRAGQLVNVQQEKSYLKTTGAKKGDQNVIPAGKYFLKTIIITGSVKLESVDGSKYSSTINKLMNEGHMRACPHRLDHEVVN